MSLSVKNGRSKTNITQKALSDRSSRRVPRTHNGEMTVSSKSGPGKPDTHMTKNEVGQLPYIIYKKINSERIKDFNIKPKTINKTFLPRRKHGKTLMTLDLAMIS